MWVIYVWTHLSYLGCFAGKSNKGPYKQKGPLSPSYKSQLVPYGSKRV